MGPSTALPIASLNPAANLRDSLSRLSTPNDHTSRPLRSPNLAKKLSNDLGSVHHDWPASPDPPSPVETAKVSRWRAKGWKDVMVNSSNLLSSVDWDLTFWKLTNASDTMHTLGIKGKDDLKGMAAFWVFGIIKYVALALGTYNSWSVKVVCDDDNLRNIRDNL